MAVDPVLFGLDGPNFRTLTLGDFFTVDGFAFPNTTAIPVPPPVLWAEAGGAWADHLAAGGVWSDGGAAGGVVPE